MKILVLGGAGYIGSVVAAQLIDSGHPVTVADNLSKGHSWAVPEGAEFRDVDLLDAPAMHRLLAEGHDAVMHFAALSLVGESVAEPVRYFRTNVAGTLNVLDAMRASGVGRLVFSSTAAVYGDPTEVPIPETAPTRPTNPYGASKLAVDHAIGFETAASGLGAVSLRYFNVAGASGDLGEVHEPETHLIPLVLQAAAGMCPAVQVYGTDYPTADGTAIRDYIHIEDLARAHLLALEAATAGRHQMFNLGNGRGFSVREVIEVAREVTGADVPATDAARRQGDPAVLVASSERIRRDLGWSPQKPSLHDMVGDAWRWMQQHLDRLQPSPGAGAGALTEARR